MEEARYWMWTKQKNSLSSHILATSTNLSSTYGDSWEEQAFAQDAAGPLGGCIWPPRSYTCSFCKREFKSAQALGGHMNVHRRDRARLKQLSPNNHLSDPATASSGIQYYSQSNNLVFDQNPSYDFLTSPPSTLRVSLPISKVVDWHEKSALSSSPPFSSKIFEEEQRNILEFSSPLNSNFVADDKYCYAISDEKKEEKSFNFLETKYRNKKRDCDAAGLSVNINYVASRYNHELNTTTSDEDVNMRYKRRRTTFDDDDDDDATVPFFPKKSLIDGKGVVHDPQVEVVEISPNLKEDLDLELRLGDHRSAKG